MHVIRELLSRLKLIQMFSWLCDGDCALEVALHANGVSPFRWQLRGIYDRPFPIIVIVPVSMAPPTRDSRMQKGLSHKFAVGARHRRLQAAGMAIQAIHAGWKVQQNLLRIKGSGSHLPSAFLRIPVDGGSEPEPFLRE